MGRSPKKHFPSAGFTLIEVLLALSIFALLGLVLYGAISLGHRATEKTQASFEKNQHLRSVMDLLGSYIRSSYPLRLVPQDAAIFYEGDEQELSFISAQSVAMGGRGMARIHVHYEQAGNGPGALRLEEEVPVLDASGSGAYHNAFTLREDVSEFRFTYLNPQVVEKEDWAEKWNGKEKRALPRAVRLSFRGEGGRAFEWTFPVMMTVLAP